MLSAMEGSVYGREKGGSNTALSGVYVRENALPWGRPDAKEAIVSLYYGLGSRTEDKR